MLHIILGVLIKPVMSSGCDDDFSKALHIQINPSNESLSFASDTELANFNSKPVKVSLNEHGALEKQVLNGSANLAKRARFSVHRDALDQQELQKLYHIEPKNGRNKVVQRLKSQFSCSRGNIWNFLTSILPVLTWLPKYKPREYLFNDVASGFTIAILHIPQGMAYGLLASVDAINGLYVSFFPVLVYFFMGTSRHISLGTFAVISLMLSSAADQIGAVVSRDTPEDSITAARFVNLSRQPLFEGGDYIGLPLSPFEYDELNDTGTSSVIAPVVAPVVAPTSDDGLDSNLWPPTRLEALTTMCLVTGIWQVLMGAFRLGSLTVVLSDQLVSGFSTGAAFHVATSQIKDLFDIRAKRFSGPFKIIYTYIEIFGDLGNTRLATLLISACAILILAVVKEQINARYREKLPMAIPIDLIVVIFATLISFLCDFNGNFGVKIMGTIPTGLPNPTPPRLDLVPAVTVSSLVIAVVAFAVSLSMAKIFAKKNKYLISPNQELFALGTSNIVSSFFLCYPSAASLSRSIVQERSGCKTQVASLVSCSLMLIVLLVIGPLFYTLPKCILASVILVALKGMFMQVLDFKRAWKISRSDAFIWLVSFLSTVLIDVDYGLVCGIIFSLLTVLVHSVTPHRCSLGNLTNTDIYLDTKRYPEAKEISGVKIYHWGAALYFANREVFKGALGKFIDSPNNSRGSGHEVLVKSKFHHLIIDCSSFSYLDCAGVETLIEVSKEFKEENVTVFLAGCSVPVYDRLHSAGYSTKVHQPSIFPTIHDAVLHCQKPTFGPKLQLDTPTNSGST